MFNIKNFFVTNFILPFVYVSSYLFFGMAIKEFTLNNYFTSLLYILLLFLDYKILFNYLLIVLKNKYDWKTYRVFNIRAKKFIKSRGIVLYYIFIQTLFFVLLCLVFPLEESIINQLSVIFPYILFYNLSIYFIPEIHIHPFYLIKNYKYHILEIKIGNQSENKIFLTKNKFFYKEDENVNLIFSNFFLSNK